jgi:hypothetical protein
LVENQLPIAGAVSLRTRIVQLLQQGSEQPEHCQFGKQIFNERRLAQKACQSLLELRVFWVGKYRAER